MIICDSKTMPSDAQLLLNRCGRRDLSPAQRDLATLERLRHARSWNLHGEIVGEGVEELSDRINALRRRIEGPFEHPLDSENF